MSSVSREHYIEMMNTLELLEKYYWISMIIDITSLQWQRSRNWTFCSFLFTYLLNCQLLLIKNIAIYSESNITTTIGQTSNFPIVFNILKTIRNIPYMCICVSFVFLEKSEKYEWDFWVTPNVKHPSWLTYDLHGIAFIKIILI